jgi:hypothetical protein
MSRAAKEALAQALEYARSGEACDHDAAHVRHFCRMAAEHIERAQYLIPDTGLEERVRDALSELPNMDLWGDDYERGALDMHHLMRQRLLALLDTPEAEPEPPPDAGVTREDIVFAAALAGGIARGHSGEKAIRNAHDYAARLRREEER